MAAVCTAYCQAEHGTGRRGRAVMGAGGAGREQGALVTLLFASHINN